MKRRNIFHSTKTALEVRESIEKYLDGVKYDLEVSSIGTTVYVSLVYYDFKPRRIVRNEIEDMASNIEIDDIRREYSDSAIVSAYFDDINDPQQIYVRLPNGEMTQTELNLLLSERMSRRNYCERA